jgi:nucleolar protein 4
MPTFVTERMRKRLASHAVKSFESEVKQNLRQPLTTDELARVVVAPEKSGMVVGDGDVDKRKDKKSSSSSSDFKGHDTGVRQAKIVRQAEWVDSLTGKGRSKGYGFIEMHKHADALRLLRWANNNPDIGSLFDAYG